jgi:hypothetical protein
MERTSSSPLDTMMVLTRGDIVRVARSDPTRPFRFARSDATRPTCNTPAMVYNNVHHIMVVLQRNERCLAHGSGREELRRLVLVNGLMERQNDAVHETRLTPRGWPTHAHLQISPLQCTPNDPSSPLPLLILPRCRPPNIPLPTSTTASESESESPSPPAPPRAPSPPQARAPPPAPHERTSRTCISRYAGPR